MTMDLAKQVEIEVNAVLELRYGIGIPAEGYAHVHVENSTAPTPNVFVVLPGGTMMSVGGDADQLVLRKRADFIAAAINAALSPLPPKWLPHQR